MDYTVCQSYFNLHTTAMCRVACACGIDMQRSTSGPFCLVGRKLNRLTPRGISNAFGETVILDHASDIQLLENNNCVSGGKAMTQLMSKVFALIGHAFVYMRHCLAPFASFWTALCRGARFLLSLCQSFFFRAKEA